MQEEKSRQVVSSMFDRIADKYDFINRVLSFGLDVLWRKKLVKLVSRLEPIKLLDVATGSGDVIFEFARQNKISEAIGVDISKEMIDVANEKMEELRFTHSIKFEEGDATQLSFGDKEFDALTISFGIRNVEDVQKALKEFHRVLKSDGTLAILEFSMPKNAIAQFGMKIHLRYILPFLGGLLSGDKEAYKYLQKTIEEFPYGEKMAEIINSAGFSKVEVHPMTLGAVTVYIARK